jgi:acyl carrier protein
MPAAQEVVSRDTDEAEFCPPGTELEQQLAELWCKAMGLERVSIRSNFFDLGGNSLMLEQLHVQLHEKLGYEEPITALFQYPTVEMLAEYLAGKSAPAPEVESASVEPSERKAAAPATNIAEKARRRRAALGLGNSSESD